MASDTEPTIILEIPMDTSIPTITAITVATMEIILMLVLSVFRVSTSTATKSFWFATIPLSIFKALPASGAAIVPSR